MFVNDAFQDQAAHPLVFIGAVLGGVAALVGHLWLADTEAEMEIKARDYDRERILRAIDRLESNTPTITKTPQAQQHPRSLKQVFTRRRNNTDRLTQQTNTTSPGRT